VAVARSSSDGSVVCYVLPVLWMTSCFHKMERENQRRSMRMLRPVRKMAAPGRSLPSQTASCWARSQFCFRPGLQFVRAEGWVFAHVGDEGYVESCAADLTRYRRHLDAEHVLIFTDVKKKHRHVSTIQITGCAVAPALC